MNLSPQITNLFIRIRGIFPRRRHFVVSTILFLSLLTVGLLVFSTAPAHAVILSFIIDAVSSVLAWLASALSSVCLAITIFLLRFFIQVAGYNGFIDAAVVKLGWTMVRDVANMFFVVALLVIAFATIIGKESYEWKKLTGKLVLVAIFINFSLLICGVIIDAAQVFTMTFLNAIAPVAGGNLITMFGLDKMKEANVPNFTAGVTPETTPINLQIMIATALGAVFSVMAMITIGAYTLMMLARMVMLWCLLILSPLAFIFQILPSTQKYATEWWGEFSKYIVMGPIMVFFLWLSFATMGNGQIAREIDDAGVNSSGVTFENVESTANESGESIGINLAATWANMANLLVGIAFLVAGLKQVGKLSVVGSGMATAALSAGKKVGMALSGASMARAAGKLAVKKAPLVGTDSLKRKWKMIAGAGTAIKERIGMARDAGAGVMDEWAAKKRKGIGRVGGFFAKGVAFLGSSVLQTGKMADRKAENWEKIGKAYEEQHELTISTSKTYAGELKLRVETEAKKAKERKDKKSAEKEAKMMQQQRGKKGSRVAKWEEDIITSAARTENIQKATQRQRDVEVAQARAAELIKVGKHGDAAAIIKSVYANQFIEDEKAAATLSQKEKRNAASKIAKDIHEIQSGSRVASSPEELKNLRKDALKMLTVAAKDGQETFSAVLADMAGQLGNFDLGADNMGDIIMETIYGKKLANVSEFNAAHDEVFSGATFRNNDEAQSVLSLLSDALTSVSLKGQNNAAGVVLPIQADATVLSGAGVTPIEGSETAYRISSTHAPNVVIDSKGKQSSVYRTDFRDYAAPRVDLKSMETLGGFATTSYDSTAGTSKMAHIDTNGLRDRLSRFKNVQDIAANISPALMKEMNDISNFEATALTELRTLITTLGTTDYPPPAPGVQNEIMKKLNETIFKSIP